MKNSVLAWLFKKTRKHVPLLIIVTLLYAAGAYLGVQIALNTKALLEVVQRNMGTLPEEGRRLAALFTGEFLKKSIALVLVVLLMLGLRFLALGLQERLNIRLERDWKADLLKKLLNGDFNTVHSYHSGDLVNRLSNDVQTVDRGIVNVLPGLLQMVTRLVAAAIVLLTLDLWLALGLLVIGTLIAIVTGGFRRKLKNLHKKESESNGRVNAFIQEALEKLLIVQAMDVSEEMEHRGDKVLDARKKVQEQQTRYRIFGNAGLSAAMSILYYGALLYSAVRLMTGSITFGTLTAVTQLVGQVEGPLANLSGVLSQYIAMKGSAERLRELDELPENTEEPLDGNALYEDMDEIVGRQLTFTYPDDTEETITKKDFVLKKGSFSCVTGESGSGKSTLLKLLLGIYTPDSGELVITGPAGEIPVKRNTRRLFSYVPQGNLLISGTLRENLLLSKPEATEEELRTALYLSDLSDFVSELPNGLDTVLLESGTGISEGQAQRLSIARALLREAPILLLDEATSSLDEATEARVLERLSRLSGKTVLAVTHRPAAKAIANGEIVF